MADDELGTGSITITLDDGTAEADADRLADRITRILDRGSREAGLRMERNIRAAIRRIEPVQIQVEADLTSFEASINRVNNLGNVPLPVVPDVDRAAFEAAIDSALSGLEVSVRVVPDLDGFDAAIRAHNTPTVTVDVDADIDRFSRALSRLGSTAGRTGGQLGGLLRLGAVGVAAAGAAQGVVSLAASLAPLAGFLAAGPAVILGYQAALGGLRIALMGVEESFSAALTGSAEDFNKSLEDLSPSAQAAAQEVRALKPAFENLRTVVQDSFFQQIEGEITATADALAGPLQEGLSRITLSWGQAAKGVLDYVQSSEGVSNVISILDAASLGVEGLADTTNGLTAGFLSVGAAVSDAFGGQFKNAVSGAGDRFAEFLQNAADSGQAVAWVNGAIDTLKQLGSILGNVGDILSGVFDASSAAGGGLLNNIERITESFAKFVNSAPGQDAISNIFSTLAAVAAQLGPILAALVTQFGAIAPALAPVFETLGPALVGLINSIGPVLAGIAPSLQSLATGLAGAFEAIGPSLGPIGEAIGGLVSAIAPLLPVVGQLVAALASALAPVLDAIADALGPVITALVDALAPVLPTLTDAFTTLARSLTPVIALIGAALGQVIESAAPLLAALATAVGQVVTAVAPLIAQFVSALLPVLPPIIAAFTAILAAVLPILPVVADLVTALAPFVALVISALAPIIQFGAEIVKWLTLTAVVPVIEGIIAVITAIVATVTTVLNAVSNFVTGMINFFTTLGSTISSLVSGFINAIVGFFASLPGRALAAVRSIVSLLGGVFTAAQAAVTARVRALVNSAVNFIRTLPSRAKAALGNVGSVLTAAGRQLVQGMINGIRSAAGALVSAAKNVVSGAINGAKSLLGISSPSKVFAEIGRFTGEGFVQGFEGTEADIERAAQQTVGKIQDAFQVDMMPVAAIAAPQLAGLEDVRKQLDDASQRLGQDSSEALFDAGVEASKGFLAGLTAQRDEIEALMLSIAQSMTTAIRSALGIRSPSRVFRDIGRLTMDGLSTGLDERMGNVRRSVLGAASAITDPFGGSAALGTGGVSNGRQAGAQGSAGTRSMVNNFTIYEVGDGATTAQRVLNRMELVGGGL